MGETRGDTGGPRLERELSFIWALIQAVPLPNYANTAASLTLWRRKASNAVDLHTA